MAKLHEKDITGYKAFNKNMTNRYNTNFIEGGIYSVSGPLMFGNEGNGYHFCKRLEDTLRYFPSIDNEIAIAEVTSLDETLEFYDDYYGYYEMYVTRKIKINKILSRKEIIEMFLNVYDDRVVRFLQDFMLTETEKELFRLRYSNNPKIQIAISYYQDGDKEAYERYYHSRKGNQKKKKNK